MRRERAKSEYNVDLTILAPETEEDYEEQNDYVRQAIESGRMRLSFRQSAIPAMRRPSTRAVAAGIRVVMIDCDVDSDGCSPARTDNVAAGRMTGEAAMNDGGRGSRARHRELLRRDTELSGAGAGGCEALLGDAA